jgi:hypothetical protein
MVSRTVLPETTAALGWKSTPLIVTVYADAGAFLAMSVSSYDRVNNVPIVFVMADVKIGARKSGATAELLVAEKFETDNMSLPVLSCSAALFGDASSAGAVYETVTVWFDVMVIPDKLAVTLFEGQFLLNPEIRTGDPFTKTLKAESGEN